MTSDILKTISGWREKLLDLSKRNRLINCRMGKTGAVVLEYPDAHTIWERLVIKGDTLTFPWKADLLGRIDGTDDEARLPFTSGESDGRQPVDTSGHHPASSAQADPDEFEVCLQSDRFDRDGSELLTRLSDKVLGGRLQRLRLNAQSSLSEQGVNTLYLAFGLLRWYESKDSDECLHSPLLLIPVNLYRASLDSPWQLSLAEEEVVPNHCLAQMMLKSFDLHMPEANDEQLMDDSSGLSCFFNGIRDLVASHDRWSVAESVLLGIFTFQKLAMWNDLGDNGERIADHPICQALAEKTSIRSQDRHSVLKARDLDDVVPPQDTFHILEADSSQHEAIEAVKRGMSLMLDGPPGTGKSQTIANIIAECLATGKRVLFVSEKSAALEVVKRRLDSAALGDFCLECHSHKANKKAVIDELGRCLRLSPEQYHIEEHEFAELQRLRQRLNGYVRALHRPRGPLGLSAFAVHGRLAKLSPQSASRCPIGNPLAIDAATFGQILETIKALVDCRSIVTDHGRHPWRGCKSTSRSLTFEDDIRHHFGILAGLLPKHSAAFRDLQELQLLSSEPTLPDLETCLKLAESASRYPTVPPRWFDGDPRAIAKAYLRLDESTKEYKNLRSTVSAYNDAAIDADWQVWCQQLKANSDHLRPLAVESHPTVRTGLAHLERAIPRIEQILRVAQEVEQAVQQVSHHLRFPPTVKPAFCRLLELCRGAELVVQLGQVPPGWFDPLRRKELKELAEQGRAEAQWLVQERASLGEMLRPAAFNADAEPILASAARFKSFLKRLLPRWRAARRQLHDLYAVDPPKRTTALLTDAKRLHDYHRRTTALKEMGKSHRVDLRATDLNNVDWESILAALATMAELDATVKLPEPSREAICQDQIDKESLWAAVERLRTNYTSLESELAAAQQNLGVLPNDVVSVIQQRSTGELIIWMRNIEKAARTRCAILSQIAAVLAEGADAEIAACQQASNVLARLREKREHIRHQIQSHLSGLESDQDAPEVLDWSGTAQLARWVLDFTSEYGPEPPRPLIAAATDPAIRQRIADSVTAIKALPLPRSTESWAFLCRVFDPDTRVSHEIVLNSTSVELLTAWLSERIADVSRIEEWTTFRTVSEQLDQLGLSPFLKEVLNNDVFLDEAGDAFLVRLYRCWLDSAYDQDEHLRGFSIDGHEKLIQRFRELDRAQIKEGFKRIRMRRLENAPGSYNEQIGAPASSELGILMREVAKKRRHLPLRQLFKRTPTLLQGLKPCLMMSPLAVSTFLDSDDLCFDVVIFDEASQVRPHDAICAIYRGQQLVVAGDQKQLPPTSFFERQAASFDDDSDEEGEGDGMVDFESILDVCSTLGLPRQRLRWHYRSRRESLIGFSNEHFYDEELVTFPSIWDVDGTSAVRLDFVSTGRWQSGTNGGFNSVEAQRTADLVMEHAKTASGRSLGVITMNQRQQFLVLDEIERRRREHPELEDFFADAKDEPFFVKNLENVQGDERDAIFLSVAYAPDQNGHLAMRFGPLNAEGGERRLNVAVTRARYSLTVVSSIRAQDIDLSRTNAVGARLLKAYLDYAERGVEALKSMVQDDGRRDADSPFEEEVARELRKRGLQVRRQVGCGGFRIDLALVDPKHPGRYVLGVECDGATYHNSATARDRDRLRQAVLEDLGWRICRIWSTDWVRDRERQVRRVLATYEDALKVPLEAPCNAPQNSTSEISNSAPTAMRHRANGLPEYDYNNIEEVPADKIESLILGVLQQCGATECDELVVNVARHLGFARTGTKISKRISDCIDNLRMRYVLGRDEDGRVRIRGNER